MWNVKDGMLWCQGEPVAVRRTVVAAVTRREQGPVEEWEARRILEIERSLSLAALSARLVRPAMAR